MKLTRRSMLTAGSAAIASTAASAALAGKTDVQKSTASAAHGDTTVDVVVIGAGISGLISRTRT